MVAKRLAPRGPGIGVISSQGGRTVRMTTFGALRARYAMARSGYAILKGIPVHRTDDDARRGTPAIPTGQASQRPTNSQAVKETLRA
jgi:hypothetical protein